ncbi:MAG TPA: hypothetical protein VN947_06565 [Polyangia bacterium]|nr:hypothetical protein [Polyangia bacterium]
MPPRTTTDALIRMRQAEVEDAMRALQRARDAADQARAVHDRTVAKQAAIEERMARLQETPARTAGQLGRREHFRAELQALLDGAAERVAASERALRESTERIASAQGLVERALRAREGAEAQRDADDKADARRRERRDQAASDDRWRPPKRG